MNYILKHRRIGKINWKDNNMELRDYQKDIVLQTQSAFKNYKRKPLIVLPCGAGKTVCFADMSRKHIAKNPQNSVWFLVHRQELIDQTTKTFEKFNIKKDRIYIGMVQTLASRIRRGKVVDKPTLIIFDEAHHATAKTWTSIVNYFDGVPIIGLTATPARMNGEGLGKIFDSMIEGVSSDWLIQNKYLAPYDYYAPKIFDKTFSLKGSDFDQSEVSSFFEKSKIYGNIKQYIDMTRKTIIYSPSIKFSKYLEENLPGVVHFDGSTPKNERRQIIEDFRNNKIKVLSNVDLIGEGFDVPDCDTIILLRPTMSLSLYIQQSMRALRYKHGKKAIIYDLVGNVFRHGMPTNKFEWTLNGKIKTENPSGEPDILVRTCKKCLLAYSGLKSICPYCGFDNKKTKKQIEEERQVQLEKIQRMEKFNKKLEQGKARNLQQLIELGKKRGYKNPRYWALQILRGRKK